MQARQLKIDLVRAGGWFNVHCPERDTAELGSGGFILFEVNDEEWLCSEDGGEEDTFTLSGA